MGKREDYTKCMRPYITGSKPKEQRRLDFCVGAKICSGRASSREEAERLCVESAKTPKPVSNKLVRKGKKPQSCEKQVLKVTECMVSKIDMNLAGNINSVGAAIANAMMECVCPPRE